MNWIGLIIQVAGTALLFMGLVSGALAISGVNATLASKFQYTGANLDWQTVESMCIIAIMMCIFIIALELGMSNKFGSSVTIMFYVVSFVLVTLLVALGSYFNPQPIFQDFASLLPIVALVLAVTWIIRLVVGSFSIYTRIKPRVL